MHFDYNDDRFLIKRSTHTFSLGSIIIFAYILRPDSVENVNKTYLCIACLNCIINKLTTEQYEIFMANVSQEYSINISTLCTYKTLLQRLFTFSVFPCSKKSAYCLFDVFKCLLEICWYYKSTIIFLQKNFYLLKRCM